MESMDDAGALAGFLAESICRRASWDSTGGQLKEHGSAPALNVGDLCIALNLTRTQGWSA